MEALKIGFESKKFIYQLIDHKSKTQLSIFFYEWCIQQEGGYKNQCFVEVCIVIKGIASFDMYYIMRCNGWQAFSWQIESHTAHQHLEYNNNSSDESKETRNGGTLVLFCDGHFTTTHSA